MRAVLEEAFGSPSFKGRRVLIQGVGAVGGRLAELLKEAGAHVIICDINEARVAELSKKHGFESVADATHLDVACDVYSPCARGATLNDTTIPKLKCKAIAGVANNQLHEPRHGDVLRGSAGHPLRARLRHQRAAASSTCRFELLPGGYDEEVLAKIDRIYDNLEAGLRRSLASKRSSRPIAADRLAERRNASPPAARSSRRCADFHF
jgi:leucine dehydrogenase